MQLVRMSWGTMMVVLVLFFPVYSVANENNGTDILPNEELFTQTYDLLEEVKTTLDNITSLISNADSESLPSAGKSLQGLKSFLGLKSWHPRNWWVTQENSNDLLCEEKSASKACPKLEEALEHLSTLLDILNNKIEEWNNDCLVSLVAINYDLQSTYIMAVDEKEVFTNSVTDAMIEKISEISKDVEKGLQAVENKLDGYQEDSNSVVLIAVMGSVGGVMVVALVGVIIYGATRKKTPNVKINKPSTPYNKLQSENIPIDAFVSEGQGPYQSQRTDPHHQASPAYMTPHSDHHAAPYTASKSESSYNTPYVTKTGQGLRRTYF